MSAGHEPVVWTVKRRRAIGGMIIAAALVALLFFVLLAYVTNRQQANATTLAAVNKVQEVGATLVAPPTTTVKAAPAATALPAPTATRPAATATVEKTAPVKVAVVAVVPTVAPSPVPTVNTDALAAEIAAGVQTQLPAGAPASVQQKVDVASQEAAVRLVQAGGTEQDAAAMASSLFNALRKQGAFCWADKTSTINEQYSSGGAYIGPQRIEISQQQQNVSHVDYYRAPGVAAISILVRGGEEAVLLGHGSIWEYPGERCNGFDFLEDLSLYAANRPDWGHSGLVFANLSDALSGQPTLNPRGLSAEQIDQLRPILFQEDQAQLASVRAVTGFVPDDREAQCKAQREDHPPVQDQQWTVSSSGGPVVINFWSNWEGLATAGESKVMVPSGTTVTLRGGGSAFFYPAGCDDVALKGYGENLNSPWTIDSSELEPYIVQ